MSAEHLNDLHHSGVHLYCKSANGQKVGHGSPGACRYAGKLEKVHDHNFDGPLICGCDDLRTE